ncbi:hypothetical protein MJO29_000329, partial [Puccinia striiformis f. sp. tritici]
ASIPTTRITPTRKEDAINAKTNPASCLVLLAHGSELLPCQCVIVPLDTSSGWISRRYFLIRSQVIRCQAWILKIRILHLVTQDTIEALKLGSREQANRLAINSLGSVRDKVCIYLDESPSSLEALELTLQLPGGPTWEDEFAMLQRELAIFKEKVVEKDFITNKRKLLKNILQLQKIYTLIPTTQEDRLLFKLGDKGVGMRPLEQAPTIEPETIMFHPKSSLSPVRNDKSTKKRSQQPILNFLQKSSHGMRSRTPAGKSKDLEMVPLIFDPASGKSHTRVNPPIHQAPELSGDVLDIVRCTAIWDWLKKLNTLLHEIMPLKVASKVVDASHGGPMHRKYKGRQEYLLLQLFVFRTVELMQKHKLVPLAHLEDFLAINDTIRLAVINVFHRSSILWSLIDRYHKCFSHFRYSNVFVGLVVEGKENIFAAQLNSTHLLPTRIKRIDPERVIDRGRYICSPHE